MQRARRIVVLLTWLLFALTTASCASSSSGVVGVRDPQRLVFFEVPSDWKVFDQAQLEGVSDLPFITQLPDFTLPVTSRVVFQAGSGGTPPDPDVSVADQPVGVAAVRSISSAQRDHISRYLLAELVVPYHSRQIAQELLKEDVSVGNGFDGVELVVAYGDDAGGSSAVVAFVSVTDPAVRRMYSIAVGCSLDCFTTHQQTIIDIIDSWLVNSDA